MVLKYILYPNGIRQIFFIFLLGMACISAMEDSLCKRTVPSLLYLTIQALHMHKSTAFVEQLQSQRIDSLCQGTTTYKEVSFEPQYFIDQFADMSKCFEEDNDFVTFVTTKIRREPEKIRRALLKQCVLPLAVVTRSRACVKKFLEYKYPVNLSPDVMGRYTGLCPAVLSAAQKSFATYRLLSGAGANIMVKDTHGNNLLTYAVRGSTFPLIRTCLAEYPHMLHEMNGHNRTPFYEAVRRSPPVTLKLCIAATQQSGLRVEEIRNRYAQAGTYLMHTALQNKHEATIPLLVKYGIPVDEVNDHGVTPLMSALGRTKFLAATKLLELGAHIHSRPGDESLVEYALLHPLGSQDQTERREKICAFLQNKQLSIRACDISMNLLEHVMLEACGTVHKQKAMAVVRYLLDVYMREKQSCELSAYVWQAIDRHELQALEDLLQSHGIFRSFLAWLGVTAEFWLGCFMGSS